MMETLKDITHELDNGLGRIGLRVETLSNVEYLLGQLAEKMNTAAHRGEEKLCFREVNRELRVLAELMHYSMKDLNENFENTSVIFNKVWKEVKKSE